MGFGPRITFKLNTPLQPLWLDAFFSCGSSPLLWLFSIFSPRKSVDCKAQVVQVILVSDSQYEVGYLLKIVATILRCLVIATTP
jgi:hypothetical protein